MKKDDRRMVSLLIIFTLAIRIAPVLTREFLSPDACLYLDIGKNFWAGKGFISAFNFYQYFNTPHYDAAVFMQPVFPLLIGFFYKLTGSVIFADLINTLICCLNVALIYMLLSSFSKLSRVFVCLIVSVNYSVYLTSLFAWTEQLHLFFFLAALFIFSRLAAEEKRSVRLSVWFGLVMGVSVLVRVASLYLIAGFLLALIYMKKRPGEVVSFFLCSVGVLFVYQAVLYLVTGKVFPEYLGAAKTFGQARLYGGYYSAATPVLNTTFKPSLPEILSLVRQTAIPKLSDFISTLNGYLGFFLWVLPFGVYMMARRGSKEDKFFLSLAGIGILNIAAYSLSVWWDPTLEITRYVLLPYIVLFIAGVYTIEKLTGLREEHKKVLLGTVFTFLFIVSFWPNLMLSIYHIRTAGALKEEKIYKDQMISWLKSNSAPSDYIATTEYGYAFPLERSVVSLPEGKMVTAENIAGFLGVFKPKLIWMRNDTVPAFSGSLGGYAKADLKGRLSENYTVFIRKGG